MRLHGFATATLMALASSSAVAADPPTCASPEHRQFDFWLGEWEVLSGKDVIATSQIERVIAGCAIRETYAQKDGYTGTSLSFYDGVLHRWRQTWVDSTGAAGEFVGELRDGAMRFTGETHRADGARVHRKMNLSPDGSTVRQVSEASRDGATWKPHYDFTYRRAP
jgi:hypothetical protein